ncbi:GATA transcription factor 23 -like protein [Gossypium arboreum]|uniref:GATA transcription factor 23-like protein n=1 Tax=Gossypium arboreum TaxID=29729 RepID=A0A0B0NTV6_GOSAR|nr:GATA transcription factor 23 -like protein [Gossypium arboreum]
MQSLCNACGIRLRKKKRAAVLGLNSDSRNITEKYKTKTGIDNVGPSGIKIQGRDMKGIENHPDDHGEKELKPCSETDPVKQPKLPYKSSPRLKISPVNHPLEPNVQQRRTATSGAALDDVSCVGMDGTPLPESKEEERGKREETMDDKEYFKHHKASPLSEVEVADTRKPITRATDGTASETEHSKGERIGWRAEQLETAEETLLRATRIWKENAMRGIPEAPHSRRLRELRGEWF